MAARNFKEAKRLKEECEALNSEGLANQQRLESLTEEVASAKKLLEKAHKDNDRVRAELEEKEYMSGGAVLMWCVILDCQQSPLPHLTLAPLKRHPPPLPPSNATPYPCPPQMPHPTLAPQLLAC